jgi:hypothetical protein
VANRPTAPLPNFPLLVLAAVGVLSLCVVFSKRAAKRSTTKFIAHPSDASESDQLTASTGTRNPERRVIGVVTMTCAYVALLQFQVADYRIATFAFVIATGLVLVERNHRQRVTVAGLAIALSLGLHFVFTRVFVIDLP